MGNILNLVFDNFKDDGRPLPNLSHLNINADNMILPFYITVMPPPEIKVNYCKINEIVMDEIYYYFIHFNENLYDGTNWEIPLHVENILRTKKNLRVVFYNEHESFSNPKKYYTELVNTIRYKKLNESFFYLVNNCSELYDLKKEYPSNINVFKTNYLVELLSKYTTVNTNVDDIITEKKFIFLCQNRRPKPHRFTLLTLLDMKDLLSSPDLIDWSLTYGVTDSYNFNSENFGGEFLLNDASFKTSFNNIREKKICYHETNNNWFHDEKFFDAYHHITIKTHQESYINIVTESHFGIDSVHITEKSFKPFYYFQLPLFVSTSNHVKYLKKEHDLYLFDDIIDHSYDNEKDKFKRLHMIVDEVKRLSKEKENIKKYYKDNISKLVHNHEYVKNYKNNKQMDNFFLSLCNKTKYII